MKCKQLVIRYQCMKGFSPQKVDRKLIFLARTLRLHLKTLTPKKNYIYWPLTRSCVTQSCFYIIFRSALLKRGSRVKGKGQEQGSRVRVKGRGHHFERWARFFSSFCPRHTSFRILFLLFDTIAMRMLTFLLQNERKNVFHFFFSLSFS